MSIESRRKAAGMTRRALADAIGATERMVGEWEEAKHMPKKEEYIRRMAMVFGCPVDELKFEMLEGWK